MKLTNLLNLILTNVPYIDNGDHTMDEVEGEIGRVSLMVYVTMVVSIITLIILIIHVCKSNKK